MCQAASPPSVGLDDERRAEFPEELGIDLEPERETEATADLFKELRTIKERHPVEPLLGGEVGATR